MNHNSDHHIWDGEFTPLHFHSFIHSSDSLLVGSFFVPSCMLMLCGLELCVTLNVHLAAHSQILALLIELLIIFICYIYLPCLILRPTTHPCPPSSCTPAETGSLGNKSVDCGNLGKLTCLWICGLQTKERDTKESLAD